MKQPNIPIIARRLALPAAMMAAIALAFSAVIDQAHFKPVSAAEVQAALALVPMVNADSTEPALGE